MVAALAHGQALLWIELHEGLHIYVRQEVQLQPEVGAQALGSLGMRKDPSFRLL